MERGLEWLFHGHSGTTRKEIIRWWEARRFRFNVSCRTSWCRDLDSCTHGWFRCSKAG